MLMKNKTALIILVLFQFSCMAGFSQDRQERDLPGFNAVALGIHARLYLTQGSMQKVEIETTGKVMDLIETEVKNNVLHIKCDSWKSMQNTDVTIRITAPEYKGLYLSGSGDMIAEKKIQSDEIEFKVSGSGTIDLKDLQAGEVESAISGSGDINLAGDAREMDVSISGSGGIQAESFTVGECSIRISGSGLWPRTGTVHFT